MAWHFPSRTYKGGFQLHGLFCEGGFQRWRFRYHLSMIWEETLRLLDILGSFGLRTREVEVRGESRKGKGEM